MPDRLMGENDTLECSKFSVILRNEQNVRWYSVAGSNSGMIKHV